MTTKRQWHPTKRAWAEAKVAEMRAAEDRCRAEYVPASNWRDVRRKVAALEAIGRDRRRFEQIAQRLKAANE